MPKARVVLPEGIRIHGLDNVPTDFKAGDVVELDSIPWRQREERLMAGHLVPLTAETAAPEPKPEPTKKPSKGKK